MIHSRTESIRLDHADHVRALAALGHDARLAIFRLLVRAGEPGLTVGQISDHLGFAPSTQAHHLRTLKDAGLLVQERNGREVINRADFTTMRSLTAFLTEECCTGVEDVLHNPAA